MNYQGAFRLIMHPRMEGRKNMAVDKVLLDQVGRGDSPPVLRLYGFSPAALSLGRYQRIKEKVLIDKLRQDNITLVRRPTGGQAVLHDNELTYSVILAKHHIDPFRKRTIYIFIAGLLLEGLKNLSIEAVSNREREGSLNNPDCFGSTGEYEITGISGRKLVGSAQVTTRTASLQHGSIPLDDSYKKISLYLGRGGEDKHKESGSIGQELGRRISYTEAVSAFAKGFETRLTAERGDLSPDEWDMVGKLNQRKYGEDEWNLMY